MSDPGQISDFRTLLSALSPDALTRGKQFERITKWWLENDPLHSRQIEKVWLWDEWPEYPGRDIGIDLVARLLDGSLMAVQAKCVNEGRAIPKSELDSFVSAASSSTFKHKMLVATTDGLSANAQRMLADQHVVRVMLSDLEASVDVWPNSIDHLDQHPVQPKATPRPHQQQAISDVATGMSDHDRGQLIMACGTGKTLTALWITEQLKPAVTLVLVPSLNLLSQTLSEWSKNTASDWSYLCVCSDDTVNKSDDQPISTVDELPFEVTTNPDDIATFLTHSGTRIIFSTYQSSARVAQAQQLTGTMFNLVICDEAHRLTGKTDADYATVLENSKIVADKRLFMTATPRTYTPAAKSKAEDRGVEITSMDDETIYGPVLHKMSFGEAIKQDLLSDYRVLIVGVTDPQVQDLIDRRELVSVNDTVTTDARTLAAHIGLAKATKDYNLKRTISFHSRIKSADQFAQAHIKILDWLPDTHKPEGTTWTGTISGAMNTGERRRLLTQLKQDDQDRHALLTNARCLTEGVDVPSLDGVAFIDPRSSQVDIIQAVGRAIRKSADKEIGTIVLPVLIPTDADAEHALQDTAFKPIWAILNALKAHDEEFALELNNLRTELGRTGAVGRLPNCLVEDLPTDIDALLPEFSHKLSVEILERSTASWDWWFGLLQSYVGEFSTPLIPSGNTYRGHQLANWVQTQRSAFNSGLISSKRAELLSSLVGWTWSPNEYFWDEHFAILNEIVKQTGDANIPKRASINGIAIGEWCQKQRNAYKRRELSTEKIQLLGSIPGWSWDILKDNWQNAYETLVQFLNQSGGRYPTAKETYNGFQLGPWVSRQRAQRSNKWMTPDRRELLEDLPNWTWQKDVENQLERLDDFLRYIKSGGSPKPAPGTSFEGLRVDYWVSGKRRAYKNGTLSSEIIKSLEAIPGWNWDSVNDRWAENYELLKSESTRNNSAMIPIREVTNGVKLGSWCQAQRKMYAQGKLSPERIALLQEIPNWTFTIFDDRWMKMYFVLQSYAEIEGHTQPDWKLKFKGERLGTWVHNQYRRYKEGNLDSEQKTLLESLPGWTWTRTLSRWKSTFKLLETFTLEHGHCTVPEDYSVHGINLQGWIYNQKQRRRYERLEEDRIRLLEGLPGWNWHVHESRWDTSYEILVSYFKGGGNLPSKKSEKYRGLDISSWVITQRGKYWEQKLTEVQIKKLSDLPNWKWEIETDSWEQGLVLLKQYISENNSSIVPDTCIFESFPLGRWVGSQRKKYKDGNLLVQRIEILETLTNWSWDPRLDTWNAMFNSLVDYSKLTGLSRPPTNLIYNGLNLGMWASRQRTNYKKGRLEHWQIEKLSSLSGWTWNLLAENWLSNFECLTRYVQMKGHSNIRASEVVENVNLGDWVQKQRQAKKMNKLSVEQIELLESVAGWEWQKTSGSGSRKNERQKETF